jgi:hypothetical protein
MKETHKPDDCTGRCSKPNPYCPKCSHAIYKGSEFTVIGKYSFVISWEFQPYYGYIFKGGNFRPNRQPGSRNKIWKTVTEWELNRGLITQKQYDAFMEGR